jgi:single-strand DNA-binding protein
MNSIILLGRTTSAIELKQTQAGKSVATFSLAVKRPYTKDTTDFHTVCAWGKQAELLSQYVNKGDQVCIRGYLTTRTWEDNQGNKRHATEVVADEITFVGKNATEPKNEPSVSVPNPTQWGKGGSYTPNAYTQPSFNTSSPQFEEIPGDENLPF